MRSCLYLVLLAVTASSVTASADRVDLAAVLEQVRSASLDPARAVTVRNLELDMGAALLLLEEGVLVPAAPVAGRTAELVFVGKGRFRIDPSDTIEASQLELFTGQPALDEPVQSAVLTVANPVVAANLINRPQGPPIAPATQEKAAQLFERWTSGTERKGFGADAAIVASSVGDEAYGTFFAAWCNSERLGDFYYVLDPTDREQVQLGQFKPIELDYGDQGRLDRELQKERRKGRLLGLRREDLGDWDTWVSMSIRGKDGSIVTGNPGFEPRNYALNVRLAPAEQRIAGVAKLELLATSGGRRFVELRLFGDLVVRRVLDADGGDLFWHRTGSRLGIILAVAPEQGKKVVITVEYDGVLLDELEKGIYSLRDTLGWYPRSGAVDRATYDVTVYWPQKFQLLASGRAVESGEKEGWRWERRRLDVPALAFTFEIGDFEVVSDRAGHVELTVAFSKASGNLDKGVIDEVVQTVKQALGFYEEAFGAYPLDYLTIVTVPRGYSQGFLSMITLSHFLVWHPPARIISSVGETRTDKRTETIAHELSHQWWGNKLGWQSYRDQWLSEALADYSAMAFVSHRADSPPIYMLRRAMRWRRSLAETTGEGRTLESLGPVVLGHRLSSSRSEAAYEAVVYDKGYVVFSMLALTLGETPFRGMLKALADAVNNRLIETATFIKAMERMSGVALKEFSARFIYGTGIPEVYYTSKFVRGEGDGWLVQGEARQAPTAAHHRFSVRRETVCGTSSAIGLPRPRPRAMPRSLYRSR